jgi:hypothetical protein
MASKARSFRVSNVKLGLDGNIIQALSKFEGRIKDEVLRASAFAGATVLYEDMRTRINSKSGKLRDSIYRYRDRNAEADYHKSYIVGPNKRKAPHWYNVEYGHWRYNRWAGRWLRSKSNPSARGPAAHDLPGRLDTPVWTPAQPYIRPTYEGSMGRAMQASLSKARELVENVMRTL